MDALLPDRLDAYIKAAFSSSDYRESGQSFIFACPQCSQRKLYIRKHDGQTTCFHCRGKDNDPGGRPEFALSMLTGESLGEIMGKLYRWTPSHLLQGRIALHELFPSERGDNDEILTMPEEPEAELPYDSYPIDDEKFSKRGREYLEGRGISMEMAQRYDVRYWTPERKIVFPIIMKGRTVGFQWRTIEKLTPIEVERDGVKKIIMPLKTMTLPKEISRDNVLMFHDRLKGSPHAIVEEGPISAMKADLCGGNVATMGKYVSPRQLDLIQEAGCTKVYLGHDPDAMEDMARIIRTRGLEEVYHLEVAKGFGDHGDMTPEHVLEMFHRARRVYSTNVFISV